MKSSDYIKYGPPLVKGLPMSSYVSAGNFVYVSGLVGVDSNGEVVSGGIAAETHQIITEAKDILKQAGCELTDVVKTSVVLTRPDDFDEFNTVYKGYFSANPPARITVCSTLVLDAAIEIDFIAYKSEQPKV